MPPITLKRFLLYRSGRAVPCPPRLTHTLCHCDFIYATMGRLKSSGPKKLSGRLKKRRPKKRIKVRFELLYGTNTVKADEILSDFSKGMIIRFFYRRNTSLPYACTATRRVSTILHLFISPLCGSAKIVRTEKAKTDYFN